MKQGWTYKKFTDVLWFQEGPGVRNTQYTESGIKLLNVSNLVEGKLDLSNSSRYISEEEAYGKYKHFLVDEGDFIIASSGIQVSYFDKKMGFARSEHLPLCMNTSTIRFKVLDENKLDILYFMFYLKSDMFKSILSRQITGSAQLNFGPSHLKRMSIPLPPLSVQQSIVAELDEINHLLSLKRKQLETYDKLAQSLFYEMFGDPVTNEKGWEVKKLGDICEIGTGSTPSRNNKDYYEGSIPWVKSTEVCNCIIDSTEEHISEIAITETNCTLYPKGSILMAMYGQGKTRGQIAILNIEATTNQAVAAILPSDKCNKLFMFQYLHLMYENIRSMARGGNQANLNLSLVKSILIPLPPLPLQQTFAQRIEAIEAQKAQVKAAIEKLETLLAARMQYWFE